MAEIIGPPAPTRCRFRWNGQEFSGEILSIVAPDSYRVRVDQSGPRFSAGSEIKVNQSEIIETIIAAVPPT